MKELQVNKQLPVVNINFDEVNSSLLAEMDKYKGIIVTEESLKDCKATQKNLAGLRNKIDTYRKDIKREIEAPIKIVDDQFKELIGLISKVEAPIKEGITVFDDKRRKERKNKALKFIIEAIEVHRLDEKYANQLTVEDKYLNLSDTIKSIKDDVEARATSLKHQQESEKAKLNIIRSSIENTLELVNKDLKTPLKTEDFERYITLGWDINAITREIKSRAELVKEAEKPKEEVKQDVSIPTDLNPIVPKAPRKPKKIDEPKYLINMVVTDTKERMAALSKFLKDNGYKYEVLENKKVE